MRAATSSTAVFSACSGLSYTLFRAPGTAQVLDFIGIVPGVPGVPGSPRTHVGTRTHAHPRPHTPTRSTRAHPPRHTRHTHHKMNGIKDLECSGCPEQADSTPEQPHSGPLSADSAPAESLAAFARRLRVHRSTITRAAQAGRLHLTPDGRVLIAESLSSWQATLAGRLDVAERHAQAREQTRSQALPQPLAATQAPAAPQNTPSGPISAPAAPVAASTNPATATATPLDADPADPTADSRAAAAARTLHWQNQHLQLDLAAAAGQELPRDALLQELSGLGAALRGGLERLTDQLSPRLAAAASDADRQRLLQAELHLLARQLAREFPRALRRLTPDAAQLGNVQAPQDLPPEAAP